MYRPDFICVPISVFGGFNIIVLHYDFSRVVLFMEDKAEESELQSDIFAVMLLLLAPYCITRFDPCTT